MEYIFIESTLIIIRYFFFLLLSSLHRVDKSLVCILAFNPFKKEKKEKNIYRQESMSYITLAIDVYVFKFKVCLIFKVYHITVRAPAIRFWQVSFIHSLLDYVHIFIHLNSVLHYIVYNKRTTKLRLTDVFVFLTFFNIKWFICCLLLQQWISICVLIWKRECTQLQVNVCHSIQTFWYLFSDNLCKQYTLIFIPVHKLLGKIHH